jgi:hypothetical protein
VLCIVVAGSVRVETAEAFAPQKPFDDLVTSRAASSTWTTVKNLLIGGSNSTSLSYGELMSGETATTQKGMGGMLLRGRVGSRLLPRLGLAASRLTLAAGAAYVGWRIYQHYNGNDTTYDLWIDSATLGADSLVNGLAVPSDLGGPSNHFQWKDATTAWVKESSAECVVVGGGDCWKLQLDPEYCADWTDARPLPSCGSFSTQADVRQTSPLQSYGEGTTQYYSYDGCVALLSPTACAPSHYYPSSGGRKRVDGLMWMVSRTIEHMQASGYTIGGVAPVIVNTPVTIGGQAVPTYQAFLPGDALSDGLGIGSLDPITGTPNVTTDYTAPADAATTETDITNVINEFNNPCGRALINHLAQPAFYPWVPGCIEAAPAAEPEADVLTLLRPLSTETYTEYITRLQGAGWVGAATLVELDPIDPEIGPDAVSKVGVTGGTGTWRRALWPATWPQIAKDTDLTIYHNPDTAPPVAPDPTDEENPPGGGDVYDPGTYECTCPPIDFGPITDRDATSKFPFGVFPWVQGIFSGLDGTEAPHFAAATPIGSLNVDFAGASDNVSAVRAYTDPLFQFVVVLGSVYWLATGVLGLGRGGVDASD